MASSISSLSSQVKPSDQTKTWALEAEQEFRLEVDFNAAVILRLVSGTAEVFGAELGAGTSYHFSGQKAAVFTWHGCTLEIQGQCNVEYVAGETPMASYLNLHTVLEQQRANVPLLPTDSSTGSSSATSFGPNVMLIGPTDAGKTSLAKILLNYAYRHGHRPLFVNLDPAEGSIVMPGTVSAAPIEHIIDPEDELDSISLDKTGQVSTPLCYHYGFPAITENPKLYGLLTAKLAQSVQARLAQNHMARRAGCIIDTGGVIDPAHYDLLRDCITDLKVNIVVVLGHERLYSDMQKMYAQSGTVTVVKLAKSGGVVNRDKDFMRRCQLRTIRKYFYGSSPQAEYSPFSTIAYYQDLKIYRVEDSIAPTSALPIGLDRKVSETRIVPMEPNLGLIHSILSVSSLDATEDESQLLESNVAGFVYVSALDEKKAKKKMTLLAPFPGRLPRKYLLYSMFNWMEM
ncbi:Cleavage polyadenylation factor subunit clp1 [Dimargaris cristalligena]|uniref:Polynucleotide 5'-hydroxyl-kinase GRC3 n=1 Tax=Dimargaris cristalligena TaxID=215637 RepID=A0A4P9ZU27_9FUNG|nr:Cleavage polyadenylation factor subunit clp1 [Dimargaris cristalligena]RKP36282.1 polyribonucleotide 5'-hydroxyl-kinase Clp1-like protein [Dimargaris cristalligena]|eukprot:RKP36282.1 polyribonucleotide 5'-hydroxyl-kinase Clp1-like protein [Dimargaris cristalligena]